MKILLIKNDGIGDLILSSGLISYIGENLADKLDLVTCEENRDIALKIEYLNNRYFISRDSIKSYSILNKNRIKIPFRMANDKCKLTRFTKYEELMIQELNSNQYDLVIVLRRYIRESSLAILNAITAKEKLCMWEIPTNLSYIKAKKLSRDAVHYTTYNIQKYVKSELEYYESILSKYFNKNIYANPKLKLKNISLTNLENKIGIVISGSSIKIPSEDWISISSYLKSKNYEVILFGGKKEKSLSDAITKKLSYVQSMVGECHFDDYEKEFSKLHAIIGNDTGLTHFASLVHKKVLVLMGGGTFESFFPWRKSSTQSIVYHPMECYNCTWVCTREIKYECLVKLFSNKKVLNQAIENFINKL